MCVFVLRGVWLGFLVMLVRGRGLRLLAILVVARKLVNVVWYVWTWTYEKKFMVK